MEAKKVQQQYFACKKSSLLIDPDGGVWEDATQVVLRMVTISRGKDDVEKEALWKPAARDKGSTGVLGPPPCTRWLLY
jgi:hypothetical protein